MKIFILILAISAQLLSYQTVKAVVNAKSIDLYRLPFQTSQKHVSHYKHGQVLHVSACNKYGWCKVENGYVKKHLLKFYNAKRYRNKNLPKYKIRNKKIKTAQETIDVKLYDPKTDTPVAVAELKEDSNLSKMALPYDVYFSNKSSQLDIESY